MRRALTLAIAGLFVLLVSAVQAQAQTYVFTAQLSGGNETPAVLTGAGGTATVTVNNTAQTIEWVVDVYNFPSGVTAGHIHVGPPGVAGPTVVNFTVVSGVSNDFRISGSAGASGINARTAQGIGSFEDVVQSLLTGQMYVNLHSQVNGGGEIRGQLTLRP